MPSLDLKELQPALAPGDDSQGPNGFKGVNEGVSLPIALAFLVASTERVPKFLRISTSTISRSPMM